MKFQASNFKFHLAGDKVVQFTARTGTPPSGGSGDEAMPLCHVNAVVPLPFGI